MDIHSEKNQAYYERNQLVCYLSKLFYSWLERHKEEDGEWEDDWRNIVFIQFPEGKYSWHIHDTEMKYFKHLPYYETDSWDGSSTEEKYRALRGEKYKAKNPILDDPFQPWCSTIDN